MVGASVSVLERPVAVPPLSLVPVPVFVVGPTGGITYANPATEQMLRMSAPALLRHDIGDIVPLDSPLIHLVSRVRESGAEFAEHDVDLSTSRLGTIIVDITAAPTSDGSVIVVMQERGVTQRVNRQLLHRDAARSIGGMSAVLAHEIKNPLAGIRGAAQLLEEALPERERALTDLIRDEADRIRALIDRMEAFGNPTAITHAAVNIHEVLGRVRQIAEAGFAPGIRIVEIYDPSLPPALGDRDQLIQVFLNIVRNAADACAGEGGEIVLTTAYRTGVRVTSPGDGVPRALPLEVTVRDNGTGVPADLLPQIFDPFVTTKAKGAGLGLALVAKIIGDHGGIVECESPPRRTLFRVLLPIAEANE
jgi:two-component system, NtrC family, nitrogen regulation sensor histidine kinase GlnL